MPSEWAMEDLIAFARENAARARASEQWRRDAHKDDLNTTDKQETEARQLAQAMTGRRYPKRSKAEREESARRHLSIAGKEAKDAERYEAIAAVLEALGK